MGGEEEACRSGHGMAAVWGARPPARRAAELFLSKHGNTAAASSKHIGEKKKKIAACAFLSQENLAVSLEMNNF